MRSPLRECGLVKEEIRRLSLEAGLPTWDKPSYACLATRIPTGRRITREDLARTEEAEEFLTALGLRDLRVRLLEDCARLQVPLAQLPAVLERREEIVTGLKRYYAGVLLDLEGRHEP